jgi:multicomponent K+:H+ antiporter subunit F
MLSTAITVALGMIAFAVALTMYRLVRGPSSVDRILALDTLAINAIAIVMLVGMTLSTAVYFEAALILAMMGFVGTAALAKFLISGDIIE